MKGFINSLVIFLLITAHIQIGLTLPSTVPAFIWSPTSQQSYSGMNVEYQTIPPKDLAKFVLSVGGWSKLLCSGEKAHQPVDVALVFVGRELRSLDISSNKHGDPALLHLIKASFTKSNFSMAFPFVAASEISKMEDSLISGFSESCGHSLDQKNVAVLESCSINGDFHKLADMQSIHDYLVSRMAKRREGKTDLIVLCNGGPDASEETDSEMVAELINSVELSGASYTFLYASDPYRSMQYPAYRTLDRFLAEGTLGNGSDNSTYCDGVCQIKSSLLEGLLVGIVLLIILISGLCCMMGIDTPTRFEIPQDT